MEIQEISTQLLNYVGFDDIVGARRLLAGVDEKDRKLIVAERDNFHYTPLFLATVQENVDMVELLVKECHADVEELDRYYTYPRQYETRYNHSCFVKLTHLVTPLWCAAASNNLEIVKLLINFGADINAASDTGYTPVLYACKLMNIDVVKYLILHGADVKKPNNDGETCLMIAIHRAKSKRDNEFVQFLIDHDSDPYMKNKDGDDAFQKASLLGRESILQKLLLKFKLPAKRWIESYELLGSYFVGRHNNTKAMSCWRRVVRMRRMNISDDVQALQPNPVYIFAKEVKTVEELERLFQNPDSVKMHALMLRERILDPNHAFIHLGLLYISDRYKIDGAYRRCIDILRYAYKLLNARRRVEQLTDRVLRVRITRPLYNLCVAYNECHQPNGIRHNFQIRFEDVFKVLQMVTSNIDSATGIIYSKEFQGDSDMPIFIMKVIIYLLKLITELDKTEDQDLNFRKIVHHLVRCQPKTNKGQTLLHLSVKESTSEITEEFFWRLSSIAVVELLLECGANANAVDDEHKTALHLCSEAIRNFQMTQHHDLITRIAALLLTNGAHADMVNHSGDSAIKGLTSSLMEMNIYDFVRLKCLAATAVVKYAIPYVGHMPVSLESFVQMHGI